MYPIGSSIQLDHRPSFSFLPSPINYVDRYSDHHIRQGSSSRRKIREQQFPRQHFETSQQPSQANHWNRPVTGLRTPPTEEEMGTTYQVPNMASYENKHVHHSAYASKTGHAERARGAMGDTIYDAATRYSTPQDYPLQPQYQQPQPHYQQQALPQGRSRASHSTTTSQPSRSRPPTRPATPSSATMSTKSQSDAVTAARDAGMVLHNLQIPTCISPNGGDLADFTAQITCLFWFESIKTLEAAENIESFPPYPPPRRLTENALAPSSFKKWVHTVLSTTQVTQNVIILALMFIYRLKVKNPGVNGRSGSEYRLLTVALMLGNKFLDDNTYTNKTWAEVSGISVTEIHVMEVEFLSNMRYGLLASKEEWEEWLVKLAKFWEYCERAQRAAPSPLVLPSTGNRNSFTSPLPSPTGMAQLTPGGQQTPQTLHAYSPTSNAPHSNNPATWPSAYQQSSATSPLALKPVLQGYRKRSYPDEDPTEPPPKRMNRQQLPSQTQPQLPGQDVSYQIPDDQSRRFVPSSTAASESLRLPVPSLSLNTNTQPLTSGLAQATAGQYASHQPSALSLPPLVPGVRAMSTVFPPSASSFAPQLPVLGSSVPSVPPLSAPSITPTSSFPPSNYGTPTKRLSPQGALTPGAGAYASSPLTDSFNNMTPMGNLGNGNGVRTPISNSPSVYLQQRPSPYKPVRHVNTLLYPPPSAFLHQYHISNGVPPSQMHYQPLGRRNEFRTGVVPEFAMARNNLFNPMHHGLPPVPAQNMQQVQHGQATQGQNPLNGQYDQGVSQYGPPQFR